jgi:hypothetical protein
MHEHEGCPHDHEFGECPLPAVETPEAEEDLSEESSSEETQIVADAAVEIAEIEAETERARIAAELEHHELSNEQQADDNDTITERTQIEADATDETEELVEELIEEVIELEEIVEEVSEEPGGVEPEAANEDDEEGEPAGDVTSVAPPARVEAPNATKKKPGRQSAFTRRHSR